SALPLRRGRGAWVACGRLRVRQLVALSPRSRRRPMRPELSERLASNADAPYRARRSVAEFLRDLGWEELTPAATLLVSELVTNACQYAPGPIGVHACDAGETLRVEVHDTSRVMPRLRAPN